MCARFEARQEAFSFLLLFNFMKNNAINCDWSFLCRGLCWTVQYASWILIMKPKNMYTRQNLCGFHNNVSWLNLVKVKIFFCVPLGTSLIIAFYSTGVVFMISCFTKLKHRIPYS